MRATASGAALWDAVSGLELRERPCSACMDGENEEEVDEYMGNAEVFCSCLLIIFCCCC